MRLVNEGFDVTESKSTQRALRKLRKQPASLALIDIDVDHATAFRLLQDMRPDIEMLGELIDRDLSIWYGSQ